jgi:hypothetical protein
MDNTPITRAKFTQLRQEILELLGFGESNFPIPPVEVIQSTQASPTESNVVDLIPTIRAITPIGAPIG